MDDLPIIDAHHHFWDLSLNKHKWLCDKERIPFRYGDYSSICKNFLVDDFKRVTTNQNVVKTIHMEAEWDPLDPIGETKWLHELHEKTGYPHAIIGQAWFCNPDIASVLADHAAYQLTRSIRQKPISTPSPDLFQPRISGSMSDPNFRNGYKYLSKHGLHYDLQTPWWHLGEASELAYDFPETKIILNHTGLPSDRSEVGLSGWYQAMSRFADQPNTAVKISGICVPGQKYTPELNRKIILDTIHIFGVDRCMFASNFPVDGVVATYDEIFDSFKQITNEFSLLDRKKMFHDNATKYYCPI